MQILYTYIDQKNRTFSNLLTLPKNLQFGSVSVPTYPCHLLFGWTTILILLYTMTLRFRCHYISIQQIRAMFFHSFCDIQFFLYIDKFKVLQLGNFLIRTVLTFWALWYWRLNNATNWTNLCLFGMTLLVSTIYPLEFLICSFWAYLI